MNVIERLHILKNNLAIKNYTRVIEGCNKVLKAEPNNFFAHNLCGLAFQGKGNFQSSINCFNRAIDLKMNNFPAMNNLANSLKALSRMDAAEAMYLKALKVNAKYINALNNYGNLKQQIGDFNGAIELYTRALTIDPNQTNVLFSLSSSYQEVGDFIKSRECANRLLKIDPTNTSTHKLISGFTDYNKDKKHLKEMELLIDKENLKDEQIIDLSFALGKAHEDIKDYEKSFKFLEMGNRLKKSKSSYNIPKHEKLFKSIMKAFEGIDFGLFKKNSKKKPMIFICGMPRSGTTLVEQIIASHKDVVGAGELIYLQHTIEKNFIEDFKINKQKILDQGLIDHNIIQEQYLELLNVHKFGDQIITDKAPQNFRWIGFMKIFFPNSKIIHCNRNPKDNCLSLYKNNFASTVMDWSYDQKDIANYYNIYSDLINFWNKKLPNDIYNANYEKIVQNKEIEIKKLIKFCGLDWDPACLNHHKNSKTPISTVSVAQARKPIYTSSLNSNDKYSKYLKEMFDNLNN